MVGSNNPRLDAYGKLHPELKDLQRSYSKADPPPERVKPIPIQLVRHAYDLLSSSKDVFQIAMADLLVIGFFFLLRPGEHTYDRENNHPFRYEDTSFDTPAGTINAVAIPDSAVATATKVHMNFTTQKNGEKDEAISHGDTADVLSPLKALRRRIKHLRDKGAHRSTPLHVIFLPNGSVLHITAGHLTNALRHSCKFIGKKLGISAKDISARALRAGGAMALLRSKIDPTLIRLMGRWKSWAMLQYLHRSAANTSNFAELMLTGGNFTISTHAVLPTDVLPLLQATAAA